MHESVLIVDDEPAITAALMTRLQACGYQVYHALNGLAALEATQMHQPDVIILDIRMPDIDGFDVCRRLKANPDHAHIPVIFLSADIQDSARKRAFDAGASAYLSKPYESSEVIKTIEKVTSETASHHE